MIFRINLEMHCECLYVYKMASEVLPLKDEALLKQEISLCNMLFQFLKKDMESTMIWFFFKISDPEFMLSLFFNSFFQCPNKLAIQTKLNFNSRLALIAAFLLRFFNLAPPLQRDFRSLLCNTK